MIKEDRCLYIVNKPEGPFGFSKSQAGFRDKAQYANQLGWADARPLVNKCEEIL